MSELYQKIAEIKARVEKVGSWRSDDFGHSVQDMIEAESIELQNQLDVVEQLCDCLLACYEAFEVTYPDFEKSPLYNNLLAKLEASK